MLPFIIRKHPAFVSWFAGLPDKTTLLRLARRLDKAKRGLFGAVKHVGEGVFEMREDFGPGWRMYYVKHGAMVIVMLGGGDKSSQHADIAAARALAATLED